MLFVHGFGHELYNARPVMAHVWRQLARTGIGVLSIDLPGCGDSAGDFGDADWAQWTAAVNVAYRWLAARSNRPLNICGLRLGAALALESAEQLPWKRIVLLQPVIQGEEMLTQFLRLRVAFSGLVNLPEERETTKKLRKMLAGGTRLEVAGYFLSPELAQAIDAVDISKRSPPERSRVYWLITGRGDIPAEWKKVEVSLVDVKPYWTHTRGEASEYGNLSRSVCRVFGDAAR
jgi:exosortase A-associated hydrolase 2